MRLELYIPFDEPIFLANSVDFADANWHDRFLAAKSKATLHVMPEELGPMPAGENPYERNNLWMLESAARFGAEKMVFICLWDGQGGDGPGGAQHFMEEAGRKTETNLTGWTRGSSGAERIGKMPRPLCFMIMPYGRRPTQAEAGHGPAEIDFNAFGTAVTFRSSRRSVTSRYARTRTPAP